MASRLLRAARRLHSTSGQIREKGATGGGHHTKEANRKLDSVLVAWALRLRRLEEKTTAAQILCGDKRS